MTLITHTDNTPLPAADLNANFVDVKGGRWKLIKLDDATEETLTNTSYATIKTGSITVSANTVVRELDLSFSRRRNGTPSTHTTQLQITDGSTTVSGTEVTSINAGPETKTDSAIFSLTAPMTGTTITFNLRSKVTAGTSYLSDVVAYVYLVDNITVEEPSFS